MKNSFAVLTTLALIKSAAYGQCSCAFSHSGAADTLAFTNLSSVANAHYYWNFGDGSTSYEQSPIHGFPESGHYLVTLFGRDTLSNCHTYHEEWIDVVHPSSDPCQPLLVDSLFTWNGSSIAMVSDASSNCSGDWAIFDYGPSWNFPPGNWVGVTNWIPALFLSRIRYLSSDSINGTLMHRGYYQTSPYNYSNALNYDNCSANFEIKAEQQANGVLMTFTAMNPAGVDTFRITGFGNPIYLGGHSVSYLYPGGSQYFPSLMYHQNTDTVNNCTTTCTIQFIPRQPVHATLPNCAMAQQPLDILVAVDGNAQFIIDTDPGIVKQWQQDAGLGWQNLTAAGQYSGVHTDTLTVADCQPWMDNYHYRCVVHGMSGCHNTSSVAVLNVGTAGFGEAGFGLFGLQPNPASDHLLLTLPDLASPSQLRIISVTGQIEQTTLLMQRTTTLDISRLANGVHVIEVIGGVYDGRQRFIKQ